MLLEFYGQECPHCLKMEDLVLRLKKEMLNNLKFGTIKKSDKNAGI